MDLISMALVAAEQAATWRERRAQTVQKLSTAGFKAFRVATKLVQQKPFELCGILDQVGAHGMLHLHNLKRTALGRALYIFFLGAQECSGLLEIGVESNEAVRKEAKKA